MKTKLTLSLLIFISFIGFGQTKYGVKAGLNSTKYTPNFKLDGIVYTEYSSRIGFYVGGYANFKLSNKLQLQPELLFKLEGSKIQPRRTFLTDVDGNITSELNIKSTTEEYIISVPLALQYKINQSFYVEGGLNTNYILTIKENFTIPSNSSDDSIINSGNQSVTIKNFDAVDVGYLVGCGYYFTDKLSANVRYSHSLNKRDNNKKSSVFNLGMAYDLF